MDTITAGKLEYILAGSNLDMQDRDSIIELMEGYAKQEVERSKVFSPNAVLAVTSDSKENKKESEVAVAFGEWVSDKYFLMTDKSGYIKLDCTDERIYNIKELYDEFEKAKATDR